MQRFRAFLRAGLCLAICCGTVACGGSSPSEGEIRLLSYNVAGLPPMLSDAAPEQNTPLISPRLNDFDLALVQEDWPPPDPNHPLSGLIDGFHDVLAMDAEHPHQSEPMPLPLGSDPMRPEAMLGDGLNRFSDLSFGDLMRVPWPGCFGGIDTSDGGAGDCLAMKGFSVATHELPGGIPVDVYNLHGEAGATETDQMLQQEGFEMLADFINDFSGDRAVILGGDTNLHTHDDHPDGHGDADAQIWTQLQADTGLTDVCEVVSPCERGIDKMAFRSSDAVTLEPAAQEYARARFQRDDGTPLSDHPPVVVELEWSRNP